MRTEEMSKRKYCLLLPTLAVAVDLAWGVLNIFLVRFFSTRNVLDVPTFVSSSLELRDALHRPILEIMIFLDRDFLWGTPVSEVIYNVLSIVFVAVIFFIAGCVLDRALRS